MMMDALEMVKHEIVDLTKAAEECSNPQLRQAIIEFRNGAEQTQVQLSKMATEKGWYISSPQADQNQMQQLKQQLSNAAAQTQGQPMQQIRV